MSTLSMVISTCKQQAKRVVLERNLYYFNPDGENNLVAESFLYYELNTLIMIQATCMPNK